MMSSYKVVSIVPQLPPQVNGIGDYAFCLAERLKSDFGVETLFIRTTTSEGNSQKNFKEHLLTSKESLQLCKALEDNKADCIILHYVGYAYSPRGYPFWLVKGIELWKKKWPQGKVITIFHELYANGKVWESAFWLHVFQKNIVFRLFKLSSGSITNSEVTHRILSSAGRPGSDFDLLSIPVFSNVGEPQILSEFKLRDEVLIIFGSAEKRKEIYAHSLESLLEWSNKLNIKKIIEIGPLREEKVQGAENLEIEQLGVLSSVAISKILTYNKYGLLQYPLALLSKSGIFAAYASHGMVPLVLGKHFMNYESDSLKSGFHYLNDVTLKTDNEKVSENIFKWYQGHRIGYLSARVFDFINKA